MLAGSTENVAQMGPKWLLRGIGKPLACRVQVCFKLSLIQDSILALFPVIGY